MIAPGGKLVEKTTSCDDRASHQFHRDVVTVKRMLAANIALTLLALGKLLLLDH
ncbi:hypothetical protein [Methylosinus sp. Sm6]|uniref:hypothetical protein n=1 Tax=Methylosinus sp. Sm6 TaxID=2866948 RepID=UPI001C991DAC|nr:hypothetical protein [Methylosinus sp. Sm6]